MSSQLDRSFHGKMAIEHTFLLIPPRYCSHPRGEWENIIGRFRKVRELKKIKGNDIGISNDINTDKKIEINADCYIEINIDNNKKSRRKCRKNEVEKMN